MSWLSIDGGWYLSLLSFKLELPLWITLVPKVLIEEPAHTSNFVVFCNRVESGFVARACRSARASVWSDLAKSRNDLDIAWAHGTQAGRWQTWHWRPAECQSLWQWLPLQIDLLRVCSLHMDSLNLDQQTFQPLPVSQVVACSFKPAASTSKPASKLCQDRRRHGLHRGRAQDVWHQPALCDVQFSIWQTNTMEKS